MSLLKYILAGKKVWKVLRQIKRNSIAIPRHYGLFFVF